MVSGLVALKGIGRIERIAVAGYPQIAVKRVAARLGEDLNAAPAVVVVLGGERILVDADLADGALGRKTSTAEAVDVEMRSGGRVIAAAGDRGELLLQGGVIVGERIELRALEDQRARVIGGACAPVLAVDVDDLIGGGHMQGHTQRFGSLVADREVVADEGLEAGCGDEQTVHAGV